jgi:hypothetical protein
MAHKTADKDAAPVTRERYIVPQRILTMRPVVDRRVEALNHLDEVLRDIIGLRPDATKELPQPPKLLEAAA